MQSQVLALHGLACHDARHNANRSALILKVTEYFAYARTKPDRVFIQEAWILADIERPVAERIQGDGRIHRWAYTPEVGRYLRVILLPDALTVHNAFFDRGFTP